MKGDSVERQLTASMQNIERSDGKICLVPPATDSGHLEGPFSQTKLRALREPV